MWFLKKWRKSKCLQQLTMVDAKSQYDNVLYKLSESDVNSYTYLINCSV